MSTLSLSSPSHQAPPAKPAPPAPPRRILLIIFRNNWHGRGRKSNGDIHSFIPQLIAPPSYPTLPFFSLLWPHFLLFVGRVAVESERDRGARGREGERKRRRDVCLCVSVIGVFAEKDVSLSGHTNRPYNVPVWGRTVGLCRFVCSWFHHSGNSASRF